MERIGIIGAGVMGLGIAQVAVQKGIEVVIFDLFDRRPGALKTSQNKLRQALYIEKKKDGKRLYTPEEADFVFTRAQFLETTPENLRALRGCNAVIEAIFENIEEKQKLYRLLEALEEEGGMNVGTPIFSNTSTIQIERLACGMQKPERFMGLHFFNPVSRMRLIEAIPHRGTSERTIEIAKEFSQVLRKIFHLAPDIPGFIVNRVAVPLIRAHNREIEDGASFEAIDSAFQDGSWPSFPAATRIVEEFINSAKGVLYDQKNAKIQLTVQEIDEIVILGLNFPLGPFALGDVMYREEAIGIKFPMGPGRFCDLVGIDVAVDCCRMMELQEPGRWPTPPILTKMVTENKLGQKSGRGFYEYDGNVRVNRVGKYAHVSYKGNILSLALVQKLIGIFKKLDKEDLWGILFEIRAKGADLKEFPLCLKDRQNGEYAIGIWHTYIRALRECSVPVTAFIRDQSLGGGYESALACDKILATKGARIGLPEVGLGILPGGGGTQNLPRRVGLARGAEMILGARVISAKKPFIDVIIPKIDHNAVLEPNQIVSWLTRFGASKKLVREAHTVGVVEYARFLFALVKVHIGWFLNGLRPPVSFWLARHAFENGYQTDIENGMWYEMVAILKAFETEDAREGISASPVFEKRKPRFIGK